MTSKRWELVAKIVDAALDNPPCARKVFVVRECHGDLELEAEVLKLLAADEQAGSFLEHPLLATLPREEAANPLISLPEGSVVSGRFEILRLIGEGGMGQVYEAYDLVLRGRIALKAIRPDISSDPRMLLRFRREVQLTRCITHPNVCRTFDIERHSTTAADGTSSELTFLTMELLEGETLAAFLRRLGRLTSAEALPLVQQMIEALSAAHAVAIIHRDFKPSNVLLVPSKPPAPAGLRVVVTDFGLARALLPEGQMAVQPASTSLTGSQSLLGTLIYMAPEQFERGEATVASDIYTLGLVMYEMVTGARPFADTIPFAEATKRIKQPAPSARILAPDLDPSWDAAICRCLEREPLKRFQSALQVAEQIAPVQGALTFRLSRVQGRLKHAPIPGPPPTKRAWRMWWVIAALIFLCGLSLLGLFLRHYRSKDAKLTGGSTVLLTDIQNSTGDRRFDGTSELIRHQLSQSPYFNLMDRAHIRDVLTRMTKSSDAPLDPPTAREVALRSGAPRVIFGAVSRVGDSYVLDIDIEQPDNDPRRARAQWENHWNWSMSSANSDKEIPSSFLSSIRDAGDWIRSEVGESSSDIAEANIPPQDVTTENWEALSEFVRAEKFKSKDNQVDNAIIALQNAVAADPHFALAYARLGDLLVLRGRYEEGYQAYRSALSQEQHGRLTRREKDRLTGVYANDTSDFPTAEAAFHDYTVYYPEDYLGWFYRAQPLMMMGRVEEALATLKKAAELNSESSPVLAHIARYNLILGNFNESSKWIEALRKAGYADDADRIEGQSDFLQGHYQEAADRFRRLKDSQNPLHRSYAYSLLIRLLAEQGQYEKSLETIEKGIAEDLETGDRGRRADKLLDRAYIDFKRGDYQAGFKDTQLALDIDRSLQRSLAAATLLGQAAPRATGAIHSQLASQLRTIRDQTPRGDFTPFSDVVRYHLAGEVLLAQGKWNLALAEFRKADQIEAPNKDREYLSRALIAAGEHASEAGQAENLRGEALAASSVLALKPGLVWQWAQDYPPGYASDAAFWFGSLAVRFHKSDENALATYIGRRAQADPGLEEVKAAKKLLDQKETEQD